MSDIILEANGFVKKFGDFMAEKMSASSFFLDAGYSIAFSALLMLAFSNTLWHFWMVFVLQGIAMGIVGTIGHAVVTDLLPKEVLGQGSSLFGATGWIGGVMGFAVAGFVVQNFGFTPTFIIGGVLSLSAIGLLTPITLRARS